MKTMDKITILFAIAILSTVQYLESIIYQSAQKYFTVRVSILKSPEEVFS